MATSKVKRRSGHGSISRSRSKTHRSRSKTFSLHGPHFESVDMIANALKGAAHYTVNKKEEAGRIAERMCSFINLFTIKELESLSGKDAILIKIIQLLLLNIKQENTDITRHFMEKCKHAISSKMNFLVKDTHRSRGGSQSGGGISFNMLLGVCTWLISSKYLVDNPETVVTSAMVKTTLVKSLGIDSTSRWFSSFFTKNDDRMVVVNLVRGPMVHMLDASLMEGSQAYTSISEDINYANFEESVNAKVIATHGIQVVSGIYGSVSCYTNHTCSDATEVVMGAALYPLFKAEKAKPRLSQYQKDLQHQIKDLEDSLKTETPNYWWSSSNETKIMELKGLIETVSGQLQNATEATRLVSGLPLLDDPKVLVAVVETIANDALRQLKSPNSRSLPPLMLISPRKASDEDYGSLVNNGSLVDLKHGSSQVSIPHLKSYSAPKASVFTSNALKAANIDKITFNVEQELSKYRGKTLDLRVLAGMAAGNDLLRKVLQSVGQSTMVNVDDILKIVSQHFKDKPHRPTPRNTAEVRSVMNRVKGYMGVATLSPSHSAEPTPLPLATSSARDLLTSVVLEAAAKQADEHNRFKLDSLYTKRATILEKNFIKFFKETTRTVTNEIMLIYPDIPGGRDGAERAARDALEESRLFGMGPQNFGSYAQSIVSCLKGEMCEKEYSKQLRKEINDVEQMKSWSLHRRVEHASIQILLCGLLMSGMVGIYSALVGSLEGIVGGVGGAIGLLLPNHRVQAARIAVQVRQAELQGMLLEAQTEAQIASLRTPSLPALPPMPAFPALPPP